MFNLAVEIALNLNHRFRTVAIVTDKYNRVVTIGVNSFQKTHPKQFYYASKLNQQDRIYLHAEIHAITRNVKRSLNFHSIYIVRIGQKGEIKLAAPCDLCRKAIEDVRIKEIYFTNNCGEVGRL